MINWLTINSYNKSNVDNVIGIRHSTTEETRVKNEQLTFKGRTHSPETKAKMVESAKLTWEKRRLDKVELTK
jgi:hypothetical protein